MTIIPQGRCLAAWVAAWALVASPAGARSPEPAGAIGSAAPRATDGGKPKALEGAPGEDAPDPGADPAATKQGTAAPSPKTEALKRATSPAATKQAEQPAKTTAAAKDGSLSERRGVTIGSGDRSLAAEKAAIDGVSTKTPIDEILARTLPPRSDRAGDWLAGAEPLHHCGEPRWIEPCIPLPPCHPSHPPHPWDLVGVAGDPTCGPIYRGPCCPRTGTHDDGPLPRLHRVNDRFFDAFYRPK